ncbi:hypothetical protein PHLGIDRAFT_30230 [Phlebiopsis gigantea 11061_1 CR5-6]|uniref:Zinc finger PHD-type domain-containing protein n=1 Tax=Phlebiopsis gigantea (strain 11061_1 CR5-6) TaxID=745531 RepID=A0A0C3SAF2_PHLG1|nr:hypothetical protein PHLGIDRAFT_30230 [Phlebiopsis gigantea 11061_1 CR5-6]
MANVATMGPPPSPKEPRRSGRRSVPSASTSKSPTGSPTTESAPKPKDNPQRPPLPLSSSSSRSKRAKNEELDEPLEENPKNGINGTTPAPAVNGRAKRKGKEKEKGLTIDIPVDEDHPKASSSTTGADVQEEEEEEAGVTRCICQESGHDESEASEFMAECDGCHAWQHGTCMGFTTPQSVPALYFCEKCKPDLYPDLLKKYAKRVRQNSIASHTNASRTSRSHSPTLLIKQPPKRRNTMNSRDAMYEQEMAMLIQVTAAEAAAAEASREGKEPLVDSPAAMNGHAPDSKDSDIILEPEPEIASARRKRKRTDEESNAPKRARSASIVSDRTHGTNVAAESPVVATKQLLPPPPSTTAIPTTTTATKSSGGRAKRGGARKTQQHAQDTISVDGDEGEQETKRPTQRGDKAREDHASRRQQPNGVNGHPPNSHQSSAAATRAYHNSHAYAVSQQPLFTSWNLPDYLSHLEHMLPTETPRPLEVRGFGANTNGADPTERTTERGVKVKWPSKRTSVVDMNKRVRALVEWVGREQAHATERSRRREAVEQALHDVPPQHLDSDALRDEEHDASTDDAPAADAKGPPALSLDGLGPQSAMSTMKQMEELMAELISFQEQFGPGARIRERERRTTTTS